MGKIIFYSNGCPKCKILKKKLEEKQIEYQENNDTDEMIKLGIDFVPVLQVGNKQLNFTQAIKWINERFAKGDC